MSFGAIADDYDRLRPPPAAEAVDWLLPERCQVAVDLGAGTGLLSRALARTVPRVLAVEPDPRMAAVLRARSPGVRVVRGRGERIPLRDGSSDAVFVSSAWHWMDPEQAAAEVWRVLRANGRFGMIWTGVDRDEGWLRGSRWMQQAGRTDGTASPGPAAGAGDDAGTQPRRSRIALPAGLFDAAETAVFQYRRTMTASDVIAMLGTYSSQITASPRAREERLAGARTALAQRFPGAQSIEVPMRSRCWRAHRAAA